MADTKKLCDALQRNGFIPHYFENVSQAARFLLDNIHDTSVGIGGSKTIEAMDIYDRLTETNTVYWHWKSPSPEVLKEANSAAVYLCSANAISEDGEIVNIDRTGNRLSSLSYGLAEVYVIVGVNKIEPSLEKAIHRARNIAAPMNCRRLGLNTPCVTEADMRCYDCDHPERICHGLLVLSRSIERNFPCHVVIINENLGY